MEQFVLKKYKIEQFFSKIFGKTHSVENLQQGSLCSQKRKILIQIDGAVGKVQNRVA